MQTLMSNLETSAMVRAFIDLKRALWQVGIMFRIRYPFKAYMHDDSLNRHAARHIAGQIS